MNYSIFRVTVQVKTLILLKFFIADSPAKHQQSGKLGLYHTISPPSTPTTTPHYNYNFN